MGRIAGRNEEDLGELHALMDVLSNDQVTIMNRIEASTEQAHFEGYVFGARLAERAMRAECWVPKIGARRIHDSALEDD